MNRSTDPRDELALLAAALCDGDVTPPQAARLEQLANRSSESRQFFLRYVQLHGELYWETAAGAGLDTLAARQPAGCAAPATAQRAEAGKAAGSPGALAKSPYRWIAAAATVASVALAVSLGIASYRDWPREPERPLGPPVVARLAQTFQAVWSDEGGDLREWETLVAGRQLNLRSGLAEVHFDCGASVILQGPASFQMGAPSQGRLQSGRLTADVSREAAGFMIYTPNSSIVHRGTEFGVAVDEGGATEVHVFDGAVGVRPHTGPAGEPAWHEVLAAKAIRVAAGAPGGVPQVYQIDVDGSGFVRDFPAPGSAAGLRALVAEHPDLIHHYTFEGVTEGEKLRDKRGDLDLVEVVMYQANGDEQFGYRRPGVDATTNAVAPYRDPARGNTVGVGLQSEAGSAPKPETVAWFIPPEAFTIELLVSFEGFVGAADGQVATAIATRTSERECGFFLAAVDRGHLVHLMDGDAPWVCSEVECVPGEWYYVASTFRVRGAETIINTYVANVTRGETALRRVVEDEVAVGKPAAGPLGIGKGFAADLAHAYPWSGTLDEVAIYNKVLDRRTLEKHLKTLVGRRE